MNIVILINSFTIISSIIFTLESFPQIIVLYKKKDGQTLSYISLFLILFGLIGYLSFSIYYNYIEIYPFIIVQIILKIFLISLKIYYDCKIKESETHKTYIV